MSALLSTPSDGVPEVSSFDSWKSALNSSVQDFKDYILSNPSTKVLTNSQYGGFSFSEEFTKEHRELAEHPANELQVPPIDYRSNPELMQAVEAFGLEEAAGSYCSMDIDIIPTVLVPHCTINEHDGSESICTQGAFSSFALEVLVEMLNNKSFLRESMLDVSNWFESLEVFDYWYDKPMQIMTKDCIKEYIEKRNRGLV